MKKTKKQLKTHYVCACGLNVYEESTTTKTAEQLEKQGAAQRRKTNGKACWFLHIVDKVCQYPNFEAHPQSKDAEIKKPPYLKYGLIGDTGNIENILF